MNRFKVLIENIELHLKQAKTKYMFGNQVSAIDYIYYHEMVSSMILSGHGTQTEFMSGDAQARIHKLSNLTKWYRLMATDKFAK